MVGVEVAGGDDARRVDEDPGSAPGLDRLAALAAAEVAAPPAAVQRPWSSRSRDRGFRATLSGGGRGGPRHENAPSPRSRARGGPRVQWTRPALPRRPKAFPHQLLRAQSAVSVSRGASPSTNRSPARHSCDLARRPSAAAAKPGPLTDTGDLPHDPKGGRWLSVLLFRQRERAWERSPQLHWFPVVDAVLRVRGSLTDAVPLRRNWIGPVFPTRVAPPRATISRCAPC